MPAQLKEWGDVVLHEGWAYGGEAAGARHGRPFAAYLAPFEQTAALCGMDWIAPHKPGQPATATATDGS
jgi:glutathione-regulated potassium-efflux system ancillary protein KefF